MPRIKRTYSAVGAMLTILLITLADPAVAAPTPGPAAPSTSGSPSSGESLERAELQSIFGADQPEADDLAVTATGTPKGFAILKASAAEGYKWQSLATLAVAGVESDSWVGNMCRTEDGSKIVAVYGPRTLSNDEELFNQGAYAAVIDIATGAVSDLGRGYTLAYFNPGCGSGNMAALTKFSLGATSIGILDAGTSTPLGTREVAAQVTSATVGADGEVYAATPQGLVKITADGVSTTVARTTGVPYDLKVDSAGGITFTTRNDKLATISRVQPSAGTGPQRLVQGDPTEIGTTRDGAGRVIITGKPSKTLSKLPSTHLLALLPAEAEISSGGAVGVEPPRTPTVEPGTESLSAATELQIPMTSREALKPFTLFGQVMPSSGQLGRTTPAKRDLMRAQGTSSATSPTEAERACAVSRNDPKMQVLQPLPRQVEWAANRAVAGELTQVSRPANWNSTGMAAYTPQTMFPKPSLVGGGRIPTQILLGVLAQESNLWQASRYTSPGQSGNPLIGDYYGNDANAGIYSNLFWQPHFATDADCGFGVAQITDGMRLAGMERTNEVPALPVAQQQAIAVDYVANIAKAVQMLSAKWNETRSAGLILNNGDVSKLENWFTTVWAYNSGFYPNKGDGSPWGVGWFNNPVNPNYSPARASFLDGHPEHASTPQYWPYPEKVLGFAAHSLELVEKQTALGGAQYISGFRPAYWLGDSTEAPFNRLNVKPPIGLFCKTTVNECSPTVAAGASPCSRTDLHCYWHGPATWKSNCPQTCGYEFVRFSPAASYMTEQINGVSFPANCNTGVPAGAIVVDDLDLSVSGSFSNTKGIRCPARTAAGSFSLNFGTPATGYSGSSASYPAKIDFHQLGGGFNDHFYFSHTRQNATGIASSITGKWTMNASLNQWVRVMIHTPDHGAWTQQARYTISGLVGGTTQTRALPQRTYSNSWRSIGVFQFAGRPSVELKNVTVDGDGIDDVAWDAVAFQPLSAKPKDFVVAMGDSFASGEGAPSVTQPPYHRETDNNGNSVAGGGSSYRPELEENRFRNACHRSDQAWSKKASISASSSTTIGERSRQLDPSLDYQFTACSGAEASGMIAGAVGRFRELSQLDQGYLDSNTTLVTLTAGGNDIGFGQALQTCVMNRFTGLGTSCAYATEGNVQGTLQQKIQAKIDGTGTGSLSLSLGTLLSEIRTRAPNAKVVLLGYPPIFQNGSECLAMYDTEQYWLNDISYSLNIKMREIALSRSTTANPIVFKDPSDYFNGHEACASEPYLNRLIPFYPGSAEGTRTAGDSASFPDYVPTGFQFGASQQSVHPNGKGTDAYARALNDALAGR